MNEQILKLVQINSDERQTNTNFMKRIKQWWDIEFPPKKKEAQNLVDNARRFKKESLGPGRNVSIQAQKNMDWTTEMKIKLVNVDDEEQSKGKWFMKRVKERWRKVMESKANGFINETGNERKLRTVTKVEDEELENIFNQVL